MGTEFFEQGIEKQTFVVCNTYYTVHKEYN